MLREEQDPPAPSVGVSRVQTQGGPWTSHSPLVPSLGSCRFCEWPAGGAQALPADGGTWCRLRPRPCLLQAHLPAEGARPQGWGGLLPLGCRLGYRLSAQACSPAGAAGWGGGCVTATRLLWTPLEPALTPILMLGPGYFQPRMPAPESSP